MKNKIHFTLIIWVLLTVNVLFSYQLIAQQPRNTAVATNEMLLLRSGTFPTNSPTPIAGFVKSSHLSFHPNTTDKYSLPGCKVRQTTIPNNSKAAFHYTDYGITKKNGRFIDPTSALAKETDTYKASQNSVNKGPSIYDYSKLYIHTMVDNHLLSKLVKGGSTVLKLFEGRVNIGRRMTERHMPNDHYVAVR